MTLEMVTFVRKIKKKHVISTIPKLPYTKTADSQNRLGEKNFFGIFVLPRVQPFREIHSQLCSIL